MPNIGVTEIAIILVIGLILFGSQRLPEAARGIGRSFNAFKNGLNGIGEAKDDLQAEVSAKPKEQHP